jgi:AraC-like DNA-binding protein
MNPPSLQVVLSSPSSPSGLVSQAEGLFVARLPESGAERVRTLDNYSFVVTPRVLAPFTTLVGKKKILTGPSRGRMILPYPPFETLESSSRERSRTIDRTEPYYVVMANVAKLQTLALDIYDRTSVSFPLDPRPFLDPTPSLMDRFILESQTEGEDRATVLESLGTLILVDLLRGCLSFETASPARYPGIKKALRFVRDNFDSEVKVQDLARIAGLSLQHFIVVFRDVTGYTPHAYLRAVRLQEAARLLREGWDVATVCFRIGFRSLSGFEQAFVRVHGVLPKAYRCHFRSS